jgi:signal-transduction protein with cAMP-binding, CBS, and nucleotidyltransferase domain
MTTTPRPYPYAPHLRATGVLTLVGLGTAWIYISRSTPYTMVLFLVVGQAMFFGAIALFSYVVVREIRARLHSMKVIRFARDEVIVRQGEPADKVFLIDEGEVDFVRDDPERGSIPLARLGPNDHFGELALLGEVPYQSTARAVTDVKLLTIHKSHFDVIYARMPRLRQRIDAEAERRRAILAEKIERKDSRR